MTVIYQMFANHRYVIVYSKHREGIFESGPEYPGPTIRRSNYIGRLSFSSNSTYLSVPIY
ncbi:hypothetical protein BD408DRAFT_422415 [Parasitella parasitica]|nr:hypothetical protein BD408DRAFT_422415 [Parasitella parasitica]